MGALHLSTSSQSSLVPLRKGPGPNCTHQPINKHQFQNLLPEATSQKAFGNPQTTGITKKDALLLNVIPLPNCTSQHPLAAAKPLLSSSDLRDGAPRTSFPHLPAATGAHQPVDGCARAQHLGRPERLDRHELLEPLQGRPEGQQHPRLQQVHEQGLCRYQPAFRILHGRHHGRHHRRRREVHRPG